jgi:hypothetical protein
VTRPAENGSLQAISERPSGRTDHDSEELREPVRTRRRPRHRVGARATREDVRPGESLLNGGVHNQTLPVQPESALLDSLELLEVGDTPTSYPTCATVRRLTVRVSLLTLPRDGGAAMTTRGAESHPTPDQVN